MNFQELQPEKLENTQYEYAENARLAIIYNDPITNKSVQLLGSATMQMSMHEYAKIRVPTGIAYNIVSLKFEELPEEISSNQHYDKSLNMFYRYLNAL